MKLDFSGQVFEKKKILQYKTSLKSVHGSRVVPCGWTDGQTDMTKLIVAFRNYVSAPNKRRYVRSPRVHSHQTVTMHETDITCTPPMDLHIISICYNNMSYCMGRYVLFFFLIKHKVLVIDRVDHRYRGRYISNAEQFHYCCCIPTEKCFSVILPAGSYEDVTCGKITLFYEPGLENSTGSRYNHTHDH